MEQGIKFPTKIMELGRKLVAIITGSGYCGKTPAAHTRYLRGHVPPPRATSFYYLQIL